MSCSALGALLLTAVSINQSLAGKETPLLIILFFLAEVGIKPVLSGIGYYEAVEQVGINGASFAGNTEVVIYGAGMSMTPQSITAIFSNSVMGQTSAGPPQPCKWRSKYFTLLCYLLKYTYIMDGKYGEAIFIFKY